MRRKIEDEWDANAVLARARGVSSFAFSVEILWRARLAPAAILGRLSDEE